MLIVTNSKKFMVWLISNTEPEWAVTPTEEEEKEDEDIPPPPPPPPSDSQLSLPPNIKNTNKEDYRSHSKSKNKHKNRNENSSDCRSNDRMIERMNEKREDEEEEYYRSRSKHHFYSKSLNHGDHNLDEKYSSYKEISPRLPYEVYDKKLISPRPHESPRNKHKIDHRRHHPYHLYHPSPSYNKQGFFFTISHFYNALISSDLYRRIPILNLFMICVIHSKLY